MDGQSGLLLAGGLASLAVQGSVGCINRRRKKKLYKTRLSSLILSKGTGKTRLKNHLNALSSDLIIVDMNEAIHDYTDELDFMKKGKFYVDDLIKQFKKKKFLLLLENKEQSEYFGVEADNSFVITPCTKLFKNLILDNIEDEDDKASVERGRLSLIKDTDRDRLNVFESFEELYVLLKRLYQLQSIF